MTRAKITVLTFLPGVIALSMILCSCRHAGRADETQANAPRTNQPSSSTAATTATTTEEKTKACFQCNGTGKMTCPDCKGRGEIDCPGHCLKLTQGTWIHMDVAGHPPTDLWQKFDRPAGQWRAYNQNHVGHIIEYRNGDWVDTGPCPICHGKGKVPCSKCDGTGEVVCDLCEGTKVVPESWTAFDNPKHRPTHFAMKDGTTLVGRKTIVIGNHAVIQTANGQMEVNTSDILAENKPSK